MTYRTSNGKIVPDENYPKRFYQVYFCWGFDARDLSFKQAEMNVEEFVFKDSWVDEKGPHVVWDCLPNKDPKMAWVLGETRFGIECVLILDDLETTRGSEDYDSEYQYEYEICSADLQKAKKMVVDAVWEDLEKLTQIIGRVEKELENLEEE